MINVYSSLLLLNIIYISSLFYVCTRIFKKVQLSDISTDITPLFPKYIDVPIMHFRLPRIIRIIITIGFGEHFDYTTIKK